jgi:hypothetical protein
MARAEQMQSFAKNAIIRNPDLAPPQPVYQNVGAAAFMDALSIAQSIATIALPFSKGAGVPTPTPAPSS